METRELLNSIYRPLHEEGKAVCSAITKNGYRAKLGYFNMHEIKINNAYQTEYFPMPEIEIYDIAVYADVGISLDSSMWMELTIGREQALRINYEKLAEKAAPEVYGANNYLYDFFGPASEPSDIKNIINLISSSKEDQIHLQFSFETVDPDALLALLDYLRETKVITSSKA